MEAAGGSGRATGFRLRCRCSSSFSRESASLKDPCRFRWMGSMSRTCSSLSSGAQRTRFFAFLTPTAPGRRAVATTLVAGVAAVGACAAFMALADAGADAGTAGSLLSASPEGCPPIRLARGKDGTVAARVAAADGGPIFTTGGSALLRLAEALLLVAELEPAEAAVGDRRWFRKRSVQKPTSSANLRYNSSSWTQSSLREAGLTPSARRLTSGGSFDSFSAAKEISVPCRMSTRSTSGPTACARNNSRSHTRRTVSASLSNKVARTSGVVLRRTLKHTPRSSTVCALCADAQN
mmetsp:Transcript_1826/g.5439  ORF Transcript_1826/g.5439 Transcript_1826/m.5439 type:complete len:294 (+) Transcript_1826:903-1784(+)